MADILIYFLALLYSAMSFICFYSNKAGYSFVKYISKIKNINILLSIEIIFLILSSFILFSSTPLNLIIGALMFAHLFGVIWVISNPRNFYEAMEESIDLHADLLEQAIVAAYLMAALASLTSRTIF
jgi:hypothetical protein